MAKKKPSLPGYGINKVRITLFTMWSAFFVITFVIFFLVGRFRKEINANQAIDAALRIGYLILPVLAAFGTFWFLPSKLKGGEDDSFIRVDGTRFFGAITLTATTQGLFLLYVILFIVTKEYSYSPNPGESFMELADRGLMFFSLVCTVGVLPVGFVLGKDVQLHPDQHAPIPASAERKEQ
jgi:hypothetical protein